MDYLKLLHNCGGYYECPKDASGKRFGPLVGYAGRDSSGRQYVGETYANFACIESTGMALYTIATDLRFFLNKQLGQFSFCGFCGAPEGGKALASTMAAHPKYGRRYIYPEKKIVREATQNSREVSRLIFSRHTPREKEKLVVVEDVCNNFSTTRELIQLIHSHGANVVAIACFLNRSTTVQGFYRYDGETSIPIVTLVQKPIFEWRQDDPEVADDVTEGNIVWKPKHEWERLMQAMEANTA